MLERKCVGAVLLVSVFGTAQAAEWSDAFIGYSYGSRYREPGIDADIAKHVVTLQYVGGYKYGTNFFTIDLLASDSDDPANNSSRGAHEVFAVYQSTLSLGKATGRPMKFGPVRDVGLQAGFEFNSKNDAFGAGLVRLVVGPKVEFDVPGFLTLGLFYFKEWNNNAIAPTVVPSASGNVNFDATARLGAAWAFDFHAGLPVVFKGFANYTGAKGDDGFGNNTAPETWADAALLWDVGSLAGKAKTFYAGLGYQYIRNKYGNQSSMPGTRVSAPSIRFEAHF